jgi:amidase
MGFSDKVDTLMIKAIADLKAGGAVVVDIEFPKTENYEDPSYQVLLYEFKDGLNKYFNEHKSHMAIKNLKDLIEYNKSDSIELRYFDQSILEQAEKKGDLNSEEYKKALSTMTKATREDGIDNVMAKYKLDAIVAPTGSPAWKTDLLLGDHFAGGSSSLAAISGYPAITVPMGFIDDLPVGVTFYAKAWNEPMLLEIAYSYEQHTKHRKSPKYKISD